jgi:hypothetical protein
MQLDFEKIKRCDVLLRLSGESSGADREVDFALSINKMVVYDLTDLERIKK